MTRENTGSPRDSDSEGEERHGSESDSGRVTVEIDHLNAVRKVLFPNGANNGKENDASDETAGDTLPSANGRAEAGLTAGSGQQPTPNNSRDILPPANGRAEDEHTMTGSGGEPSPTRGQNAVGNPQTQASDIQDNTVGLSKAQIAAQRSARRRDASGRFLPMDEETKQATAGENSLGAEGAAANLSSDGGISNVTNVPRADEPASGTNDELRAAFEQGLRERDLARAGADAAIAVHIEELMAIKQRRLKRQEADRRRRRNDGHSLAKLMKTVRQLAVTLHTAEQFQQLSRTVQQKLYDYCNSKLHAFLLRSLGDTYSHLLPPPEAGGPAHGDGLRAWRVIKLRHAERSASSEAYWLQAFMKLQFASTGNRLAPANIRTYTEKLSQLSLSYKQASTPQLRDC